MTGELSTSSRHSSGPARTGQVAMLMHASAYGAAHSGGSVSDRNLPPGTWISACAAISAQRRERDGRPVLPFGRFVPGGHVGVIDLDRGHRAEAARAVLHLDLAPLQVQEAGYDGDPGLVRALQQALGLADGRLGGVDIAVG